MAQPYESSNALNRCFRTWGLVKGVAAVLGLMLPLLFVAPAHATHESINIDGNLTDLVGAIGRNQGGANGGFSVADPFGEVYTSSCSYVNGFDVQNYYFFLDFKNASGNFTRPVTLYAGWEVFGIIGDVDGNESGPTAPRSCAPFGDVAGIGALESYTVEFDVDCDGATDISIGIKDNKVQQLLPVTADLSGQASFAIQDSTLELRVDGLQAILDGLIDQGRLPPGTDLCNARIKMTANAELDGLGEDRNVPAFQLEVPPSLVVTKTPDKQSICPNQPVTWTIKVKNDGLCLLDEVTVDDVLDAGMTFTSAVPARNAGGTAQTSRWSFTDLAPGDSLTILLTAQHGSACNGQLTNNVTAEGVHIPPALCGTAPRGAIAMADAFVNCSVPVCAITATPTGPLCAGAAVELCGPEGNYSYAWTRPDGSTASGRCLTIAAAMASDAGTYTLVVTDNVSGCASEPCTYVLVVNELPVCSITATPPGGTAGSSALCMGATLELCGPVGNYSYAWTRPDGSTTTGRCLTIAAAMASDAGTYTLVVTDLATGCMSAPCTYQVTVNPPPVCSITGAPTGPVELGASFELCGPVGNYSYAWTRPDGSAATGRCLTIASATAADIGTYTLVVTDLATGCASAPCSVTVVTCTPPVCSITATPSGPLCVGASVELCGPEGNFTYSWTRPNGSTTTGRCLTIAAATASDAGTYTLVVTDVATGCVSTPCTYVLTVNPPPVCSITATPPGSTAGSSTLCQGGALELCGPEGNYSYAWTRPNGSTATGRCLTIAAAMASDAGTYTLVVTDLATGCMSAPCTYQVTVNPPPVCSITGAPAGPVELGASFELCGPVGNYSYAWTRPNGSSATGRCLTIASATAADFGTYTLVVTDLATGCMSSSCSVMIARCDPPVCSITGPSVVCVGESYELCGPEGNFSYRWTLPDGSIETTRCVTGVGLEDLSGIGSENAGPGGAYSLELTSLSTGCVSQPCTKTVTVNPPPPCAITGAPVEPVDVGASFTLCGPTGNYSYLWTLPNGSTRTGSCVTVTAATVADFGNYSLVVTDLASGCASAPCMVTITGCDPPVCAITGPSSVCIGDPLELCGPTGNYRYEWTAPDGAVQVTTTACVTFAVPLSGIYTLKVIDVASGCASAPCTKLIKVNKRPPCAIAGPDTVCPDQPTQLCGPVGNYSYAWTLPDGTTRSGQCINLTIPLHGVYRLVVTDLETGCMSEPCTFDLKVRKRPVCAIAGPEPLCAGSSTQLCGPVGNYSYAWTKPDGSTAGTRCLTFSSVQVSDAGVYTLVVTDAATGCQSVACTFELVVNAPAPCVITATPPGTGGTSALCVGGSLQLCGPEGNYTYAWTRPNGQTATGRCLAITNAQAADAGTYRLVVTNVASGCVSAPCTYQVTVGVEPPCQITALPPLPPRPGSPPNTRHLCLGGELQLCGPEGNYTYAWTRPNGQMATTRCVSITNAGAGDAGTYQLVVTDVASGCASAPCTYVVTVGPPPLCVITPSPSGPVMVGAAVELCGPASAGPPAGPYTYKWTKPNGQMETTRCVTIGSVQPGDAGVYTLVVTDALGCASTPCSYELMVSNPICNVELVKTVKPEVLVPQPQPDCETIGKPRTMTFRYTGEGCSATRHNQDASKVSCQDLGSLSGAVQVVYTGSNASRFTVTPSGEVLQVGDEVTISTSDDRFPSETLVEIRKGGVAVQKLKFHTSCSQPLAVGNQFGSLLLLGWNGVTGNSNEVTYTYVVRNNGSPLVNATLTDDKLGVIATGLTLGMGETRMYTRMATITSTTTNVATVVGRLIDANGPECRKSATATVKVEPPPLTCEDGKPRSLVFEYTGQGCSASRNGQGDKAKCSDLGTLGSAPVQIVYTGKDPGQFTVIPSGEVIGVGDRFTISATGRDRFHSNSLLEIRRGGQVLQKLEIHTSCSQPLNVGDQFGSLLLREFHITLLTATTPVGSDVAVDLGGDAQVTFAQVTGAGTTLLTYGVAAGELPAGLVAVNGEAVQLSSSATYSGAVNVAVRYDEAALAAPEAMVKLLRHDGVSWQEITSGVDATHNMVLGTCTGLASFVVAAPVAALAADEPEARLEFALRASYPNPTSGRTTIRYVLSRGGPVSLTVHDVQGRQVGRLEGGTRGAGEHTAVWSGRAADGRKLPAGLYLLRLESGEGLRTAKLVMMD